MLAWAIHTDFWDPVFTAACDTETVLCTHVGSASRGAQTSTDAPASVPVDAALQAPPAGRARRRRGWR